MQEVRGNMSHVDDGTLHAYLDGELTPVERARLEGHVAECAACRNRLDEERALIERASGLLGLAQPPERAAPPLHQLRRPSVVWRLRVPVAWAATVLLALGLGYYAGDRTSLSGAPEPVVMRSADSSAAQEASATPPPRLGYAPPRVQSPAPPRQLAATEPKREAEREPVMVVDGAPVRSRLDTVQVGANAATGVVTIRSRDTGAANAAASPAPRATLPTARAAAPEAMREEAITTGASAAQLPDARRLVATQWPIIRRGPARQILGAEPMGVPGLAVRNIRRSPTGEVVLVEQAIDSVTVIQLFQERAENDQFARAYWSDSARQQAGGVQVRGGTSGTERLARFIGGVRVEIAGPLSADSLNRLLEQVKPISP
jgi:hypothetical protein